MFYLSEGPVGMGMMIFSAAGGGGGGTVSSAGILEQSVRVRNQLGIGYRPARLHRLSETIPHGIDSWAS